MRIQASRITQAVTITIVVLTIGVNDADATTVKCLVADRGICKKACEKVGGKLSTSPSGLSHSCTYSAYMPSTDWYTFADLNVHYQALGRNALDNFRQTDLNWGEARSRRGTNAGIGSTFQLNSWITLDFSLSVGAGSQSAQSLESDAHAQPVASVVTEYQIYSGAAAARLYVYRQPHFMNWIHVGVQSTVTEPSGGSLTVGGRDTPVSSRQFRSTTTNEPVIGVGLSVPLWRRRHISGGAIIKHPLRSGWSAGVLISFGIRRVTVLPPEFEDVAEPR